MTRMPGGGDDGPPKFKKFAGVISELGRTELERGEFERFKKGFVKTLHAIQTDLGYSPASGRAQECEDQILWILFEFMKEHGSSKEDIEYDHIEEVCRLVLGPVKPN